MGKEFNTLQALDMPEAEFDLTAAFKKVNPWIENYGYDAYTLHAERYDETARYIFHNEFKQVFGLPWTFVLQAGLIYGCGIYTAQQ